MIRLAQMVLKECSWRVLWYLGGSAMVYVTQAGTGRGLICCTLFKRGDVLLVSITTTQHCRENRMATTQTEKKAPPRVRRAQIVSLVLLMLSGIINYMDRGTLSVANQAIRHDMGLSLGQMGVLLSAFSWSYSLMQLPVGALVDRKGPRRLLGAGLAFWSLAQGICGLVTSYGQFIFLRIVLGVGEAPQFPSAARVVSNWFPLRARGLPTGIFNAASPLGTALAPLLLTMFMVSFSWRTMFVFMGVVGLILAAIWVMVYRDPADLGLNQEEQAYLDRDAEEAPANSKIGFSDWCSLFRYRTTWGMILGYFGSVYLNWVYLTWLPGYLTMERHMSLLHSGFAASLPFFCGFLGCLSAGWFSDRLALNNSNLVAGRRLPVVLAMLGMAAFTVPAALVQSNTVALICISIVIFLANAASACSWALATAAAPANRVASLGSMQNFGGFIGGSLAPILTGFITGACIAFVGALCYWFLVRSPIPDEEQPGQRA